MLADGSLLETPAVQIPHIITQTMVHRIRRIMEASILAVLTTAVSTVAATVGLTVVVVSMEAEAIIDYVLHEVSAPVAGAVDTCGSAVAVHVASRRWL